MDWAKSIEKMEESLVVDVFIEISNIKRRSHGNSVEDIERGLDDRHIHFC